MPKIESFEDLVVWQRAMDLMEQCYAFTRRFPREERWALSSQLQRASLSVASNIAEGNGRRHRGEYLHHLSIAKGSLNETHTLLLAAARLRYVHRDNVQPTLDAAALLGRQLMALTRALQASQDGKPR